MKKLRIAVLLVFLLALLTNAVAMAQGEEPPDDPLNITALTVSPNPGFLGDPISFSATYDLYNFLGNLVPLGDHLALCLYIRPSGDRNAWVANFPATTNGNNATYTKLDSTRCPDRTGLDDFYYYTTNTTNLADGDSVTFDVTVPDTIAAGTDKLLQMWVFTGNDCDNSIGDGTDAPGGTSCNGRAGLRGAPFTILDPADTIYVATDCSLITGTCYDGATALQDAITAAPTTGLLHIYDDVTSGSAVINNKNLTIDSEPGASLTCSGGGTLLSVTGSGSLVLDALTLDGNNACATGISVNSTNSRTLRIESSLIQNFTTAGVAVNATTAVINSSDFTGNAVGLAANAGTLSVRGTDFTNNDSYALTQGTAVVTMFGGNITGNNGGGYQADIDTPANAGIAKNWWGSASDASVGPNAGTGWARRLGAPVDAVAWGSTAGSVTLGSASLSSQGAIAGQPVIISFGRAAAPGDAPFGNGVMPYVANLCSEFYDFYVVAGDGDDWQIALPIDNSTDCNTNTLAAERVYKITPYTYDTDCDSSSETICWDLVDPADVEVGTNELLITQTGTELVATHFVAGNINGNDPTAIQLSNLTVSPARTWLPWGLLVVSLVLGGVGLYVARRKL
jgi:hypothetical protein